ncbi:trypsin-like serine peptidase [Streptomyces syringium]|uniref:trypsin-like serine peptidase n=1 Tax=Streptomyces syringium TaxID=76729 RepID=UPI003403E4AF
MRRLITKVAACVVAVAALSMAPVSAAQHALPGDRLDEFGSAAPIPHVPPDGQPKSTPAKGRSGASPAHRLADWSAGPNRTIGRLYVTTPAGPGARCVAATVPSQFHNLVVTSGHCLSPGGGGAYYTDFRFVPAYQKDRPAPYGEFKGKKPSVNRAWGRDGDDRNDFGFLTLEPNAEGKQVGSAVGENGFEVNQPVVASRTVWSYLFDDTPAECFGQTRVYAPPPENRLRIDCRYERSSSGGPWLDGYSTSTQTGFVNGVLSGAPTSNPNIILSPYFDDGIWDLYQLNANRP